MIPTQGKTRLPKTLSYPMGSEAISEAFSGIELPENLELSFRDDYFPAVEFHRKVRERQPYTIFEMNYYPFWRAGFISPKDDAEHWKISVYPVLRELKHLANTLLLTHGLPMIVEWFRCSEQGGWKSQHHSAELIFSAAEESIVIKTTTR